MIHFIVDSYSHRANVRAKLGGDPEWQSEYFQKILPWLQHQDNFTMKRSSRKIVLSLECNVLLKFQFDVSSV